MINIHSLEFSHLKREKLFQNLNFRLEPGSITGLLGKNGAGKTSLLKLVAGMLFPRNGEIEVLGHKPKKRQPGFLEMVYYLPEEFFLPNTSIKNYIKANSGFYPSFDHELMKHQLQKFEIPMGNRLDKMSYGQKKKFLISFSLATKCKLLILDEPTNGLDIPSKTIFRKLLAGALADDQLVLISTHQIKDVENLIDRIMVLSNGEIVLDQEILDISDKFRFTTMPDLTSKDIIYHETSPGGYRVILPGAGNSSQVDMELLFNAITKGIKLF
ncbi:ABC transporter ATP-binding protein [Salegentibacter salegens]|uniref:ABC-2 type transport system ATP-binding protein n=1 Tax=Salegentibacter salegens TaxID=143223 RepID=A0A1M7HKR0_9FLAO|nr:ABC transporter ATP-binding protein [Salegentibacter salegens]PRX39054.1 ABC-2 type transport system ATP-binding protein [Salegentibacter salegens]SHM29018.1 ABC-2 type transport system ATP-binding protein [Salegentibacter salegens]